MLRLVTRSLVLINLVSTVLGAAAVLLGGGLEGLGSGAGGLAGVPSMLMLGLAIVSAAAGAWMIASSLRNRRRMAPGLLLAIGPALVFAASFQLPHSLDPCAAGVWGLRDRFDGTRLCWPAAGGLNIHERFHLLSHGAPGLAASAVLAVAVRRKQEVLPPADDTTSAALAAI